MYVLQDVSILYIVKFGSPFMSDSEYMIRKQWTINDYCKIYSQTFHSWLNGVIIRIDYDKHGEWLTVQYSKPGLKEPWLTKQIQRFNEWIKPFNVQTSPLFVLYFV